MENVTAFLNSNNSVSKVYLQYVMITLMMANNIDICIEKYARHRIILFENDVNEIVTLLGHLIPYYPKRVCKPPDAVQSKLFVFIFPLKDFGKLLSSV